jgi:hypothetical protein
MITPADVTRELATFDGSRIAVHDPHQLTGGPLFAIVPAEDLRRLQRDDHAEVVRCARINSQRSDDPTLQRCPSCGELLPPDGDDLDAELNQTRFDDADEWTPQNERNFRQAMRDAGLSVDDDADDDFTWTDADEIRYQRIMREQAEQKADEEAQANADALDEYRRQLDQAAEDLDRAMGRTTVAH